MQILEKSGILVLARQLALQDFAQLVALHLAGRRARQLGYGADPSRTFVPRQSQLAGPGGGPQRLCGIAARGHEQRQAIEAIRIGHQDAGGLADRRLERRSRVELSRLQPLPGNLDQLVGAALVYEKAVGVLHEHVPRAEPSIAKLLLRLVGQIGVAARLRRMLHPEHALPIEADLDSGERPAGARAVRGSGRRDHAGTECLGHAVEVEQFAANRPLPVLDELRRKPLATGDEAKASASVDLPQRSRQRDARRPSRASSAVRPGHASANKSSTTTSRAELSCRTCRYSASESLLLSAIATAPMRTAPSQVAANSAVSRMRSSTRSPAPTPNEASAPAARFMRAASSA